MRIVWCDYDFVVCPPEIDWPEEPGLYVFARFRSERWEALYVGQTDNLRKRLPTHERWPGAKQFGATHFHVRIELDEQERRAIEKRLIRKLQPPMNVLGL